MDDVKLKNCWVVVTDFMKAGLVRTGNLDGAPSPMKSTEPETVDIHEVPELTVLNAVEEVGPKDHVRSKQEQINAGKPVNKLRKPRSLFKPHRKREQGTSNSASASCAKDHLLQKYGSSLLRKPSFSFEVTQTSCREITDTQMLNPLAFESSHHGNSKSSQEMPTDTSTNPQKPANALKRQKRDFILRAQSVHKHTACDKTCPSTIDRTEPRICDPQKDLALNSEKGPLLHSLSNCDRPDSESEVIQHDNQCHTNPSCKMPAVGFSVDVGLGRQLKPLQARCALTCLDDCKSSILPQYAEFCSSVVKSTLKPSLHTVIMPIRDEHILDFMRIKWNSKSAIKQFALPSPMSSKFASKSDAPSTLSVPFSSKEVIGEVHTNESTCVPADNSINSFDSQICDPQSKPSQRKQSSRRKRKQTFVCTEDNMSISEASGVSNVAGEDSNASMKTQGSRKRAKLTLLGDHKEKLLSKEMERRQSGESISPIDNIKSSVVEANGPLGEDISHRKHLTTIVDHPQPSYDPDDMRGIESSEEMTRGPVEIVRHISPHVVHELRRLNVAVFDVTNCHEPVVCKFPDICRLGCVCSSLLGKVQRDNCGLEDCMFECSCSKPPTSRRESYTWVQNKARENLAKEERHFKQAVVRSDNDSLILVEGRKKRNIKVPERYREDIGSNMELQVLRQFGAKDLKDPEQKQSKIPRKRSLLCVPGGSDRADLKEDNSKDHMKVEQNLGHFESAYEDVNLDDCDELLETYDTGVSARTESLVYVRSADCTEKQKKLLSESACEKIEVVNELKIVSTQSLAEENPQGKCTSTSDQDSCLFLFNPDFIDKKKEEVVLLPWTALRQDVIKKLIYLWISEPSSRPKIYLTKSLKKPCERCMELLSIEDSSDIYKDLPFHLKSLRSEYVVSDDDVNCVWIAKYVKGEWMIAGYLQPDQKSEKICETKEVDIFTSFNEDVEYRWWVMDIRQDFDLVYFIDFKKAMTKHQITTLVKLSNEELEGGEKIHRILLNRRRPKIDPRPTPYPDFGAYGIWNHPFEVFIGPYTSSREPRFHVYAQKVAHNGRAEYEKIPLFYCGAGENVRVNSRGVLSLRSEYPPKKYVKGVWYQSCGKEFRKTSEQLVSAVSIDDDEDERKSPLLETNLVDLTEEDSVPPNHEVLGGSIANESWDSKSATDTEYEKNMKKQRRSITSKDEDIEEPKAKKDFQHSSLNKTHFTRCSLKNGGISLLKKTQASTSLPDKCVRSKPDVALSPPEDWKSDPLNKTVDSMKQHMEYLVPSEKGIGILPITHLPSGIISVPHFTDASMLKFYHFKEDIIKDINQLIHQKLVCLSKKCKLLLRPNEICKCVSWKACSSIEESANLPWFKPDLFNGFFMLTRFGLVDLRTADKGIICSLGKDWVEWLKNDEIRLKLNAWKNEEIEVTEKHYDLMRVIASSQKSDMSLLQVLAVATDEIAKLKAQDQLLDLENQTQKLMKETLIYSLCRKLNGVPGEVVPQLLEQLDLGLLWEVLECMDSRNTSLLPDEDTLCSPPDEHETFSDLCTEKVDIEKNSSAKPDKKKKKGSKKQHHIKASSDELVQKKKPPLSTLNETLSQPSMDGLVCRVSPFARLNICVEEGGIKYGSAPTAPCLTSPNRAEENSLTMKNELQLSPVKPPNILRKNKNPQSVLAGNTSPMGTHCHKQARKQKLFNHTDDEAPIFEGDPGIIEPTFSKSPYLYVHQVSNEESQASSSSILSGDILSPQSAVAVSKPNEEDPISAVQISSVVSDVAWDDDLLNSPALKGDSTKVVISPQNHLLISHSVVNSNKEEDSDPISSLKISSVYSAKAIPSNSASNSDPMSSLRISSVVSGGIPAALPYPESRASTHEVLPVPSSTSLKKASLMKVNDALPRIFINKSNLKPILPSSFSQRLQGKTFGMTASLQKFAPVFIKTKALPMSSTVSKKELELSKSDNQGKSNSGFTLNVPLSSIKLLPPSALNKQHVVLGKKSPIIVSVAGNSSPAIPSSSMLLGGNESETKKSPSADKQPPISKKNDE